VGRGMSRNKPIGGDRALPPMEFRVYRQPRSVNVWQMLLRRKQTDTDKPTPTTFLRQPQTYSTGKAGSLAPGNTGDPLPKPFENTAWTRASLRGGGRAQESRKGVSEW
jgi:hypothetical protein